MFRQFDFPARTVLAMSLVGVLALPAHAATITLVGTQFDLSYDNAGFIFQTGETYNPDTMALEPFYEQLGGFSIVAPDRVRYSLRPQEVFFDSSTTTIVPGGLVEVGGSALSSASASDAQTFMLLPKAGFGALSVQMLALGSYANPTDSATLTYSESIAAAGASGGLALSLGVFSSGPLPSGSTAAFVARNTPFGVNFAFTVDGVSSDLFVNSSASVGHVDFLVSSVPEPRSWMLLLGGLAALGAVARRSASRHAGGAGAATSSLPA